MSVLRSHNILPLFVWIDDAVASADQMGKKTGRPSVLRDSEVVTILIFNLFVCQQQTLRQVYEWVKQYHQADFPKLPAYQNFVVHCHRVLPLLNTLLRRLLQDRTQHRFMDATMLPVCTLVRRRWHRVARGIAHTGHNWQGEHYGFKLHTSIDNDGKLCAYVFSSANIHDSRAIPYLVNKYTRTAVGDSGYRSALNRRPYRMYGTIFVVPPHYKQRKQLLTRSQWKLLKADRRLRQFSII